MNGQNEITQYVGYFALRGSSDLAVTVTARSYSQAEGLLTVWRDRKGSENATADDLLSARPVRIESDEHALAELDEALDRVAEHARRDGWTVAGNVMLDSPKPHRERVSPVLFLDDSLTDDELSDANVALREMLTDGSAS
jgi:hypothetical protein